MAERKKRSEGPNFKSNSLKSSPNNPGKKKLKTQTDDQRHRGNSMRETIRENTPNSLRKNNSRPKMPPTKDPERDRPVKPNQKHAFLTFAKDCFDVGVSGILKRYEEQIKPFVAPNRTRAAFDANMDKNRYKDVICIDETRVVLKDNNGPDYIHANRVEGEPFINRFICAQAPMAKTVRDFWRMIIENKVNNIFMLCETVEEGKPKCEQYWPREVGCTIDWPGVVIRNTEVDDGDTTTIMTTLEVTVMGVTEKLVVKHHQWRTWPDKSVPHSVMAPFRLLKIARGASSPTIVHCSAGIGRTGTVVGLEMALQTALCGRELRMVEIVQKLRMKRGQAVQTDLQFVYMHKCILAFLQAHKVFSDQPQLIQKSAIFEQDYNALLKTREAAGVDQMYSPVVPLIFGTSNPSPNHPHCQW